MSFQENIKVDRSAMIGIEMAGQGKQIPVLKGGLRGLSRIRPQMMQQVFSSTVLSEAKRAAHFPTQMELLKLFPESRTPLSNGVKDSRSVSGNPSEKQSTAQLIIFYNGEVQAYDVSADKAEAVLKLANSNSLSERATLKPSHGENQESKRVTAGLPLAKKLSLQRFLEKRKERIGRLTPYNKKTCSKVQAKEEEDECLQIKLCLSFPSQRSG